MNKLDAKYFTAKESRKKKGAGKGYKVSYTMVWREGVKPCDYLRELASTDRTACGILLCRIEQDDFCTDRYWDVANFRDEAIRLYRERIKAIRLNYGLTKSEVAEFMRVN